MIKIAFPLVMATVASSLVGCAHTPDATAHYYLPRTEFSVKVLRTVACDGLKKPIMHVSVAGTPTYVADMEGRDDRPAQQQIRFAELDGAFAKSATTVSFHPAGTLSGVNAESEGQGKDIFIAALKAVALTQGVLSSQRSQLGKPNLRIDDLGFEKECEFIKSSTKDAVITLAYEGKVDLQAPIGSVQPIAPSHESSIAHERLQNMVGQVCAKVMERAKPMVPVSAVDGGELKLVLREPGLTTVSVHGGLPCPEIEYWADKVLDGRNGEPYEVPVPKAAMFGRNSFEIAVSESGRISKLSYEKDSGASGSLDAASALFEAAKGQSVAEKAAALDAEADLILAQERLAKCEADPPNCTK